MNLCFHGLYFYKGGGAFLAALQVDALFDLLFVFRWLIYGQISELLYGGIDICFLMLQIWF